MSIVTSNSTLAINIVVMVMSSWVETGTVAALASVSLNISNSALIAWSTLKNKSD